MDMEYDMSLLYSTQDGMAAESNEFPWKFAPTGTISLQFHFTNNLPSLTSMGCCAGRYESQVNP